MQAVLVAYHELRGLHVFSRRIITGQQCQHGGGISVQQFFSLVVQQQIAQTLQHGNRLIVVHRHGHQHGRALAFHVKRIGRTAHGDSAAQVAFSTVVQPDTLTQVQRLIVNHARHKRGIRRAGFFQTTRVKRLQRYQIGGNHVQLQRFTLFFAHQQGAQLFSCGRGLQLFSHIVIAQDMRQLTQQT